VPLREQDDNQVQLKALANCVFLSADYAAKELL